MNHTFSSYKIILQTVLILLLSQHIFLNDFLQACLED